MSSSVALEASAEKLRQLVELRELVRAKRESLAAGWTTVGRFAAALDPTTVQTPALDMIDGALAKIRDGELERLIISMPPQEGKSKRVSHYGVLDMLRRNSNLRIGIVSYGDDNASRISYEIRNDIVTFDGSEGALDLGMRLRSDNKAASRWNLKWPHKGGVYAVGIGGSLTGRPLDVLVIDDPVKDYRDADSLLLSELAWQWWMSVARPRLAPGAPVIVILTRWHENDLAGRLLAKQKEDEQTGLEHYDKWHVINIPAQADHDPKRGEVDPLGRKPGEFLESARGRTQAQWRATKAATSPRIWSALYQGRPSPVDGDIWEARWWARYMQPIWRAQPDGTMRVPEGWTLVQSWDMAFKGKKDTDYVVGEVWAERGVDTYLVDIVRGRMSFTSTLAAFRRLTLKWPQAVAKLVEDKANGPAVIDTLKTEIAGIIAVEPGQDSKQSRASAVAPVIESGNVHLPTTAIALFDVEAFIDEAKQFPNGANDDQVDGASQYLKRFIGNQQKGTIGGARGGSLPGVGGRGLDPVPILPPARKYGSARNG